MSNLKLYDFVKDYFGGDFCAGVVPDGTYEVCSRTTGQAAAGEFTFGITFAICIR